MYASTENEEVEDEQPTQDQPPLAEEQPEPTAVQELQQLQAQLLSLQQERDRVAAAFAASQQEALATTQAEVIRQQLSILQAKIQSMQPTPQCDSTVALRNVHPASYSDANRGTIDLKSPLSEGLQASLWLASYKPIVERSKWLEGSE